MSNFACLGSPSQEASQALLEATMQLAQPWSGWSRHRLWRDLSGAALAFHLEGAHQVDCANPFFQPGSEFAHLHLEALPGLVDVVASDPELGQTPPGSLAFLMGWLVGLPVEPPPAPPRGFWSRLLGRG